MPRLLLYGHGKRIRMMCRVTRTWSLATTLESIDHTSDSTEELEATRKLTLVDPLGIHDIRH
jgi:hypothetical protein